jgi:hypothetical protein
MSNLKRAGQRILRIYVTQSQFQITIGLHLRKKNSVKPWMLASEVVEMDLLSYISFGDGICNEVNEVIP